MNHAEYMEMVRNGQNNVVKWGTYVDTRYLPKQEQPEQPLLSEEELAALAFTDEEIEAAYPSEGGYDAEGGYGVGDEYGAEGEYGGEVSLSEAEAIAARVQAQAESRIQDDVTKLVGQIQDEEAASLAEAEAIAARVQAQAESRIQDDVTKLIDSMQEN